MQGLLLAVSGLNGEKGIYIKKQNELSVHPVLMIKKYTKISLDFLMCICYNQGVGKPHRRATSVFKTYKALIRLLALGGLLLSTHYYLDCNRNCI